MGKPLINPAVIYEHEPINESAMESIFDYLMSLVTEDDPSILEDIAV